MATFRSTASAEAALELARQAHDEDGARGVVGALLEKGAAGELVVSRHQHSSEPYPQHALLLGAALTVLAPPVGVLILAGAVSDRTLWAVLAHLVSRMWHDIPQHTLRRMSDILEEDQASLLIVAVDRDDLALLLAPVAAAIVSAQIEADLEAAS